MALFTGHEETLDGEASMKICESYAMAFTVTRPDLKQTSEGDFGQWSCCEFEIIISEVGHLSVHVPLGFIYL